MSLLVRDAASRTWTNPDQTQLVVGDGTVPKTLVWGPKFVFLSARSPHYHERVGLDLRHQPPKHPGGDAGLTVEAVTDLAQAAPGMLAVVWDGALRGVHRSALAKTGLLVVNRQHGGMLPERLSALRGKGASTTCGPSTDASPNAPSPQTAPPNTDPCLSPG